MDRFEVPSIRETIKNVTKKQYFTSLDLKSGYNQMKVAEECSSVWVKFFTELVS